jgi:hypothetical protein
MLLNEVRVIRAHRNIQPFTRHQSSFVEGIFVGVAQRDKFVVLSKIRERERGDPADRLQGGVTRPSNSR